MTRKIKKIMLLMIGLCLCNTITLIPKSKNQPKTKIKHDIEAEKHTAPLEGYMADIRSVVISLKKKLSKFMLWEEQAKKDVEIAENEHGVQSKKYKHHRAIYDKAKTAQKHVQAQIKRLARKIKEYEEIAHDALEKAEDLKEEIKKLQLGQEYRPKQRIQRHVTKQDIAARFKAKMQKRAESKK